MSPLNYALQYEMSKKLSKLLYTVDDDIMSVEPLVGDSNYNSVATIKRNGKITRVKYNRKKMDDTLNNICLTKRTDTSGNVSLVCLTPSVGPDDIGSIPEDWNAEQTKTHLDMYGITWNRTMGSIMDTDHKVFNMVGSRNPVGIFDVANNVTNVEANAYRIRNVEQDMPFGTLAIKHGEQVSFKVPFNVEYSHGLVISNGTVSGKIGGLNARDIQDNENLTIYGNAGDGGYISHGWMESGTSDIFRTTVTNDLTVLYTVKYDSNGVKVSVTDDTKTTILDKYETLTDKVFICLSFRYTDPVVSPTSRPEINFTVNKQVDENAPPLNTMTFPLTRRLGMGRYIRDENGELAITPLGFEWEPKTCVLNFSCHPGINRLKFTTEITQAFNSEYLSEITIGMTQYGIDYYQDLPYFKLKKRPDGEWDQIRHDFPNPIKLVANDDIRNFDIAYDSERNNFLVYANTDPNDTSALDTEPVQQTPTTYLLMDERNFTINSPNTSICNFVVRLVYNKQFDRIPTIKTTRYTPAPAVKKFNFINAVYTTIGDMCTTHYGSTTYPVTFSKRVALKVTDNFKLGYHRIDAMANIIGSDDVFVMGSDDEETNLPNRRRLIITTERLTTADLMAGKYQGIVVTYSGVEMVMIGDIPIVKYNKREMVNTLPAVFTLKESTNDNGNSQSDIDRVPQLLQLLGDESNQHALYRLMVDISATEYYIYDIRQDYAYNPADQQT